jgi:ABC-type antimicrobial peptide transport system permease subunit
MIKNYFKIAYRNLLRNKSFSIINISGLTIGMASAILILLWIQNEVSYDRFYTKINRLHEVWSNDKINGSIRSLTNTPEIMAPALKKDYPEVEDVTRVQWTRNLFSVNGENKLMSTGAVVDHGFLNMFNFPLINGNAITILNDPHSIVLTQKLANKLFNSTDVVGKTIVMGKSENYTVTGVLKDLPGNTQFNFIEYLCSYEEKTLDKSIDNDWTDISIPTYVLLKPNTSPELVSEKIKNIIPQHTNGSQKTEEFLYPVSKGWLYSQFENGEATGGRIRMVRTFSIIALFILLIACINFMNLSTARSERRAKEVGIRKVSGALKTSLIAQFIGESVLITFIAALFAIIIVELCLPAFNQLVGKQLFIAYDSAYSWLSGIAFILFTGFLAGSYPAFFLSSFKPVSVLKGSFKKINALVTPRKILVVLQFTFAIALIICTIVVRQQINYAQERNAGYNKDHLVNIYLNDEMQKNFSLIKQDLLSTNTAAGVAEISAPLTSNWSSGIRLEWQGKDQNLKVQINRMAEEGDLVKTAGMQLLQGRDIDLKNYPSDSTACLINESALKLMKFKNPIGQIIVDYPVSWHVVGVINDYIQESPYQPINPMIIKGPKEWMGVILARLNGNNSTAKNLAGMEKIFKHYNPDYPFEYTFIDEEYAQKFSSEELIKKLAAIFAGLTIFISCLGLFGLAAYMAANRIKEIGIRKVLGASVANVAALLSKDFIKLVIIAIVIASPVAWWVMNKWLQGYNYRINISGWIFIVAGSLAILIALITVSFQAIKAAVANPVKSLRTE